VHRYGLHVLGIFALLIPASSMAQRTRAPSDSFAVVQAGSATHVEWEPSVVREVPLLGEGEAPDESPGESPHDPSAERPHWKVNVVREVRFVSTNEVIRARAATVPGLRLEVDVEDHRLYAIDGLDTLRSATVATASDGTLTFGKKSWHFRTPFGMRTVKAKDKEPVWIPPEWHYAEVASEYGLRLRYLSRGEKVRISDGTVLLTKGKEVGVIPPGETEFVPLVLNEHIVFDSTLYIPPAGTRNRTMKGELGHFRLKLGNGIQIHGTPYASSLGTSATHGCVRMNDDDIRWMYENVPVGTKVFIY
jgi:lipoprotein-anchoring transpeptidase ErfK/SrfK